MLSHCHAALYANDTHPHRTPTSGGAGFGDGLNPLSDFPYEDLRRDRWNSCNGTRLPDAQGLHLVPDPPR